MRGALVFLLGLALTQCYLFSSEERIYAKGFYFQDCLHSNLTVCITLNLTGASLEPTCVADESKCTGPFSSYLRRSSCEECSHLWCPETFLCTNEASLCGPGSPVTKCEDDTPACYPRGTVETRYGDCVCATGFTGKSCSQCELAPQYPDMEYICCEDKTFDHGIQLVAAKRQDLGGFLKGDFTSGNCTSRVINDCDCLTMGVNHMENANPFFYYQGMETNDSKSGNKLGQGILAFIISLIAALFCVIIFVVAVYYFSKRRRPEKKKERQV